jgi:tRNA modification GTPase
VTAPDTIAAIATPPGRGGIGIVRISGARLDAFIDGIVGVALAPRHATRSTFRDAAGAPIDAGLALWFPAPHSYTGEAVLELHGHGAPRATNAEHRRSSSSSVNRSRFGRNVMSSAMQ